LWVLRTSVGVALVGVTWLASVSMQCPNTHARKTSTFGQRNSDGHSELHTSRQQQQLAAPRHRRRLSSGVKQARVTSERVTAP
jgi:hypothetical protein